MTKRQRSKLRKNTVITMDLQSLPRGMDLYEWYNTLLTTGVILWDSSTKGSKPTVFPKKRKIVLKIKEIPPTWDVDKWTAEQKRMGLKFIDNFNK